MNLSFGNIFKSPLVGLFLLLVGFVSAQETQLIHGTILDSKTGKPVPYVTISIQNKYIGTVTNAQGYFQIHIDQESLDTLQITMLGYKKQVYAVDQLRDSSIFKLKVEDFMTDEVIVRPRSPEEYIKLAVNNIKKHSHPYAYNTQTYFKEEVKINDKFLGESESVFKSYAYSIKRHKFQLMLHRGTYDSTLETGIFFTNDDPRDFAMGPEFIMRYANDKSIDFFLDSNQFKKYNYYFAPDTIPGFMIIAFEPKGKIERMKMGGQIILESGTHAIVEVRYSGIMKIPIVAKPLLAVVGYGYRTPYFDVVKKYQKIEGKWFPSYTYLSGGLTLINKHLFSKNEVFVYRMNQILHVNKIIKKHVKMIPASKRYDYKKNYEEQIHNDDKLEWSDVNVIK